MRIVHVAKTTSHAGGAETYLLELARAQAQRGDDVRVLAPDPQPARDVDVAPFTTAALDGADVVHLHGLPLEREDEERVLREHRVVRSLHDYSFMCATGERWFRDGTICHRTHGPVCISNFVVRGCAHRLDLRPPLRRYAEIGRRLPAVLSTPQTIVYSDYLRTEALRQGIPAERCHSIPYFVDASGPLPQPGGRVVLFAGRVVERKGLDVLLEALALDPRSWDSLIVAGDGWDLERSRALAASLGLTARVDFRGWTDTRAALAEASVLALPSRWPEPFGIAGIEAMAAGRPVVASDVGGIREWLVDGETGVLVPPGDKQALADGIVRALARRDELGAAAARRAQHYSADDHLRRLDEVYAA